MGMSERGTTAPGLLTCGPVVVTDPVFKRQPFHIKLCLDQPLVGPPDIRDLAGLCVTAEAHLERVIRLNSADTFNPQVLTDVENKCKKLYPNEKPVDVLQALGIYRFCPYLEQGMATGKLQPVDTHAGSSYLTYINNVNQLVMMATQIYNDACVPSHHKYIAHQLALLYQCLNQLQGETKPIRRIIESRFEEIKAITESSHPVFEAELSNWLQQIAWLCREEIKGCPPYVHKRVGPFMAVIKHQAQRDEPQATSSPTKRESVSPRKFLA